MSDTRPPLDYLATCSKPSLEAFELGRLNRAANLRKELRDILEEWIQAEGEARLARWLLEGRRARDSEMQLSARESKARHESAVQVPLSFLQGRDETTEWSMISGTALLGESNESCDGTSGLATDSIPILPPRPEIPDSDRPGAAKASAREGGALAELRSTGGAVVPGLSAACYSIGRHAGSSEKSPPLQSSVDAAGEQPYACGQSCNLHPAIQLTLVPRRSGDDPFGEADHAPAVGPSVSVHLLKARDLQEAESPVQPRIHFGRPVARGGEMAAAS